VQTDEKDSHGGGLHDLYQAGKQGRHDDQPDQYQHRLLHPGREHTEMIQGERHHATSVV